MNRSKTSTLGVRGLAVRVLAVRWLVVRGLAASAPVVLALVVLTAAAGRGYGQSAASSEPKDPAALMTVAHDKNGLVGADVTPWHLRARYSAFELNGQFDYQGTYEEWWIDPTHYKIRFTNPRFAQTEYATGTALYREGYADWVGGRELRMRNALLDPLPVAADLGDFSLSMMAGAGGRVACVLMKYPAGLKAKARDANFVTACFEPSNPVLRLTMNQGTEQIRYDDTVLFEGHYVARQVQYMSVGQLVGEMQVDVLEPLKETAQEVLAVPADAQPVDLAHIQFSAVEGTGAGGGLALLERALPRYPLQGPDSHDLGGMVDLEAGFGADGRVTELKLLSAKNMMSVSATDAVRGWRLAPLMVMGQARPFEAEIKLVFATH